MKTYLIYPKVLTGKEKDFAIWLGNYRNGLYKNRFINGETVDGITRMEVLYNGSDDNEWDL